MEFSFKYNVIYYVSDSYESVEVTVNGFEVKVITYSVGLERLLVVDRYDDISDLDLYEIFSLLFL